MSFVTEIGSHTRGTIIGTVAANTETTIYTGPTTGRSTIVSLWLFRENAATGDVEVKLNGEEIVLLDSSVAKTLEVPGPLRIAESEPLAINNKDATNAMRYAITIAEGQQRPHWLPSGQFQPAVGALGQGDEIVLLTRAQIVDRSAHGLFIPTCNLRVGEAGGEFVVPELQVHDPVGATTTIYRRGDTSATQSIHHDIWIPLRDMPDEATTKIRLFGANADAGQTTSASAEGQVYADFATL